MTFSKKETKMINFTKEQIENAKTDTVGEYNTVGQILASYSALALGEELDEVRGAEVINEGQTADEYWIDIEGEEDGNEVLEIEFDGKKYFVLFVAGSESVWKVFALNAI